MKPSKLLYALLVLLPNIVILTGCEEATESRTEVLTKMEADFYNSVKNINWHQENMEIAAKKTQEAEEALRFLSECLQNAPSGNSIAIHSIGSTISEIKNNLESYQKEYAKHSYNYKSAVFIISNYVEGGCLKEALESDRIEFIELKD